MTRSTEVARLKRQRFGALVVLVGIVVALLMSVLARWAANYVEIPTWLLYSAIGTVVAAGFLLAVERAGAHTSGLGEWKALRSLKSVRRFLIAAIVAVVLGVLATAVYEALQ